MENTAKKAIKKAANTTPSSINKIAKAAKTINVEVTETANGIINDFVTEGKAVAEIASKSIKEGHRWHNIEKQVYVLEDTQANIRKFRPWYDASFRELSILKRLTESFPEDGTVSAKQIEIRDPNKPGELLTITCTGTARTRTALLKVKDTLAKARNVTGIEGGAERGTSPLEFEFKFKWSEGQ